MLGYCDLLLVSVFVHGVMLLCFSVDWLLFIAECLLILVAFLWLFILFDCLLNGWFVLLVYCSLTSAVSLIALRYDVSGGMCCICLCSGSGCYVCLCGLILFGGIILLECLFNRF